MQKFTLPAANSIPTAVVRDSSLAGLWIDVLHRWSSFQPNYFWVVGFKGCQKNWTVVLLAWSFISWDLADRVIGYAHSPKMKRKYVIYSPVMRGAMSSSWRRGWTGEELKAFGLKMCESKKNVVELFSSVSTSGLYMMRFYLPAHFLEHIRTFRVISVLDTTFHKQLNIHFKKVYWRSSERRAARMQETVKLMERQQISERPRMSTEIGSRLQSLLHRSPSKYVEGPVELVQLIWSVCLDVVVRCVVCDEKVENRNWNMRILLNKFSKQLIEGLVDLVKKDGRIKVEHGLWESFTCLCQQAAL